MSKGSNNTSSSTSNNSINKYPVDNGQDVDIEENINQETADRKENDAEEIKEGMKSGASLAKNAATGNALGAAKDALNLAKNKKVRNKIIRHTIIQIVAPFLIILLCASAIFGILGSVVDTIGKAIGGIGEAIVDFFTTNESDGAIMISTDQIDTIINSIEESGVSTEDLKLLGDYDENATEEEKQEATRKYIRKFYEAQALTETLNYYHKESTDKVTYGAIYLYRTNGEDVNNRKELTYKPYEKMQELISNNNRDAANYFSIDESDNLVIASVDEETTTTSAGRKETTYTVTKRTLDYKSAVSQYTTKMTFLVDLALISQNPEFVSAVVDLIKDSRIEITVMDTVTTNVRTETLTYKQYYRVEADRGPTPGTSGAYIGGSNEEISEENLPTMTFTTTTTTINRNPSFKINYVKTWFCEQKKDFKLKTDGPKQISSSTTYPEDETVPATGSGNWKVDQKLEITDTQTTVSYEEVPGELEFTLGEQGDGEKYANGEIDEPTFIGLMETEFRIPYATRTEVAGSNLVSGADMLFYLLQKDAELQNMETIMRYALYLYSGKDYGVTELDASIFEIQDFVSLGTSGSADDLLLEYIGYWESSGNPPKNADGTKYIIIDDGYGNLAVGYGVDIYNSGYADRFIEAGYTIAEGAEVDVDFVDNIKMEIISKNKAAVNALGLDLTGYQFNALVSFCYNVGNVNGFKPLYNAYWVQERDDRYGESSPDTTHPLYTQYFSKYVWASGEVAPGLVRRRLSEWALFQTGSYGYDTTVKKMHPAAGDLTGDSQIEDGYFAYPCPGHTWSTYDDHEGIDISWSGCEGEPVYAAQAGTVSLIQTGHVNNQGSEGMASYGNCVFIQHENGWESRYAHMTSVAVTEGQHVEQGQVLGYIGNTGNSYGAHLHISLYSPSGSAWNGSRNWAEVAWPQYRS